MKSISLHYNMNGYIFDIQRFCVHDGPGIRTTVFMKGCHLSCAWCHNPEGISVNETVGFNKNECIGCNICNGVRNAVTAQNCPGGAIKVYGRKIDEQTLLKEVLRDRDFYVTDGGVTFSGGECLLQADFVSEMLRLIKNEGINTAIDTSGYVKKENIIKTADYTDLYLYDIKCANGELHKRFIGADNKIIIDNFKIISDFGKKIWVRVPVIPDFNDNIGEMTETAKIIAYSKTVEKVTLMPYHTLGKSKYETLNMPVKYSTDKVITKDKLNSFKNVFENYGINAD